MSFRTLFFVCFLAIASLVAYANIDQLSNWFQTKFNTTASPSNEQRVESDQDSADPFDAMDYEETDPYHERSEYELEPVNPSVEDKCGSDPFDKFNNIFSQFESLALDFMGEQITEADEMAIGDQLHEQICKQFRINDNHREMVRLKRIMDKLTPYVKRKKINYKMHIIEDDQFVNAFAIAGGHLHVSTGLLKEVGSEDELAFIIGHEIGHVDAQHCLRIIQKIMIAEQFGEIGEIAGSIGMLLTSSFGQVNEYESDKCGAHFCCKAGFDARRGLDFFSRLEQRERYDVFEKITRSHPYSSERKTCLKEYINKNCR